MEMKPVQKRLVYTEHPFNGGLVVASVDRALFVSQIYKALRDSRTWGEFRQNMPAAEYSRLLAEWQENGDDRAEAGDGDPFDGPDDMPEVSDGDYPPWLQSEMDKIIPKELLREFGAYTSTRLNGDFYHIDPGKLPQLKPRLEHLGYTVEDGSDLLFY
jgi:hypothetical protein